MNYTQNKYPVFSECKYTTHFLSLTNFFESIFSFICNTKNST